MTGKQIVDPGWAYDKAFQYSQAVRAGNLLLLSGQCPVDAQGNTVAAGTSGARPGRSSRT